MRENDRHREVLERLMVRDQPARAPAFRLASWLALLALGAVGVWVVQLPRQPVPTLGIWDLQDPQRAVPWMHDVLVRYTLHGCAFVLLGVTVPTLFLRRRSRDNRLAPGKASFDSDSRDNLPGTPRRRALRRTLGGVLVHVLFAIAYVALVLGVAVSIFGALTFSWGLQLTSELAIGLSGLLVGLWLGVWWRYGRRGRTALLIQVTAIMTCAAMFGVLLHRQVIQPEPLGFEAIAITSADKRELIDVLKQKSTLQNDYRVYHVATPDLNKLLAWWMTVVSVEGKARVELFDECQQLQASVRFPIGSQPKTFVNFVATGNCEIVDQQLDLTLDSLHIGSLNVPSSLARWLGRLANRWISYDSGNTELLTGVMLAVADPRGVEVTVSADGIKRRRLAKLLRRMGDHPDVTRAVRMHLKEYAEIVRNAGRKDPLFEVVVRKAFELAQIRSGPDRAVEENRAAIVALGIALGHLQLAGFVGDVLQPDSDRETYVNVWRLSRQSTLRGRVDWPRHFWVSAAVTLLASDNVSDALGLLKEELDAGTGGSGFSFGDLAADRAGTEFARMATRSADSARAIQRWVLAPNTDLQRLMPDAADLPEGMDDAAMQARFDGVGGQRHRELEAEIERRVQDLPWQR